MTSPRLAECEARQASASLFPGVEYTRRPARVSTFWAGSAPSPQKSPNFPNPKYSWLDRLTGPSFKPSIFINNYCLLQGWVIRRIRIIRRIVFNVYFTVLNKLGRIIRSQNLPFLPVFGLSRQFPPPTTVF
jgi:hypothetical protein